MDDERAAYGLPRSFSVMSQQSANPGPAGSSRARLRKEEVRDSIINELCKFVEDGNIRLSSYIVQKIRVFLMTSRWRIKFTSLDIMRAMRCICYRVSRGTYRQKKQLYFQKGAAKVQKDLDCITFLKRMRHIELVTSLMLSQNQQLLLNYQKKGNILSLEDEEGAIKKEGGGIFQILKSNRHSQTDFSRSRKQKAIEEAIKSLEEHSKLDRKEEQLMYGLFTENARSILDNLQEGDLPIGLSDAAKERLKPPEGNLEYYEY